MKALFRILGTALPLLSPALPSLCWIRSSTTRPRSMWRKSSSPRTPKMTPRRPPRPHRLTPRAKPKWRRSQSGERSQSGGPNPNPVEVGPAVAPKDENGKFDPTKIAEASDFGDWEEQGCKG